MINLKLDVPCEFLKGEERCGFWISAEMKKAWAVMLDLLVEFDRVCRKNGIQYFASGGTFLGAVRHKGFIPWDDDIDVMMTRENYKRLCEIGPREFKHPYFLQNKYTDPCCCDLMSKLRNSDTTALMTNELGSRIKYNKGIFIDIFPLDNVPDDLSERENFLNEIEVAKKQFFQIGKSLGIYTPERLQPKKFVKELLFSLLANKRKRNISCYWEKLKELENILDRYNQEDSKYFYSFVFDYEEKELKQRMCYKKITEMPFEFIKIPAGTNYDVALTDKYGDWRTFVKGTSFHSDIFFDTDNSYLKYAE